MSCNPNMAKVEYAIEVLNGQSTVPPNPPERNAKRFPEHTHWSKMFKADMNIMDLDLYQNCVDEMMDYHRFDPSSHATSGTYRAGCRGPMCTYARSRSRSDRTGGVNFLSNDLIEYLIVLFWSRADDCKKRKIYDAPRNIIIFYSRLKAKGLTAEIDEMLDDDFPFVGVPASPVQSLEAEAPPAAQ